MEDNIIVAIEIGSSKVTGVAGHKLPDGGIQVLALAQEPSSSFIRKGAIFNADKATQCINNIISKLQKTLKRRIYKVYLGLGGKGIHTVKNTVTKELDTQTGITHELIDSLLDINRTTAMTDKEILDVVPQEYKVGTQFETNPIGVLTDHIEGRFVNIVARPQLSENMRHCFQTVDIVAQPISALALADVLLTDTERRSGCVLLDMGAGTTTVAIFKSNILRQLTVLPLGGENLTKDIMTQFSIEENEAEKLKIKHAVAYTPVEEIAKTAAEEIELEDERTIKAGLLNEIVEARTEEILRNVSHQIKKSGYTANQLLGGIIVTGGASFLNGLDKAIREFTGFEKLRIARNIQVNVRMPQNQEGRMKDGQLFTVLALLDKGTVNCCSDDLNQPAATASLFGPGDENPHVPSGPSPAELARLKAQQEAQQKEAERLKAEEEARRLEEERIKQEKEAEKERRRAKRSQRWNKFTGWINNMLNDDDNER